MWLEPTEGKAHVSTTADYPVACAQFCSYACYIQNKRRAEKWHGDSLEWRAYMKAAKLWEAQGDTVRRERYLTKALLFLEALQRGPEKETTEEEDNTVGCGTLLSAGGDVYDGEFKGMRRDGVGIYRFGDGRAYASTFENNKPVGTGVFWTPDRQKAWRVVNGDAEEEVSPEEGKILAAKIGQDVPPPYSPSDGS